MFGTAFIAEHSWMPGIFSLWRVMCWDGIFCLDFCRASWKYRNSNVFGFSQVFNSIPLCLRALTSILMWVLPNWITNRITSLWLCVCIKRLDPVKAGGVCWIVHVFFLAYLIFFPYPVLHSVGVSMDHDLLYSAVWKGGSLEWAAAPQAAGSRLWCNCSL